MASFTDKAPVFNPYVQQVPVETMAMVGMQKQQQYDTNVQRISEQIEKVAGLDIVRDIDKTYLQSKLNELGNNLRTFAASDFSNYQLTNNVTGMVSNVAKDKYVLNAVNSTAKYRKELEHMEEARKKGELTEQNKYDFDLYANDYLNNNDLNSSFNGSYKPYFDRVGHIREVINSLKPDGKTFDDLYTVDSKGNLILSPTMRKLKMKGLMPQKVREAIDYAFSDPRVRQQAEIDGQYFYRGMDSEMLDYKLASLKEATLGTLSREEELIRVRMQSGMATQEDLDKIENSKDLVNSRYEEMAELAFTNPDQIRKALYIDDEKAKLVNMYSWMETSEEVLENPEWVWNYKRMRDDIKDQQWAANYQLALNADERAERESEAKINKLNAEAQEALLTNNNTTGKPSTTQLKVGTDYSKALAAETQFLEAKQNFTNSSLDLINIGIIETNPKYKDMFIQETSKGMSYDDANKKVILQYIKDKRLDANQRASVDEAQAILNNANASYSEKLKASEYIADVIAKNETELVKTVISANVLPEYEGFPTFDEDGELLVSNLGPQIDGTNVRLSKAITDYVDNKNMLKYHENVKNEVNSVRDRALNSAGVFSALDEFVGQSLEQDGISSADYNNMSEEEKERLRNAPVVSLRNRGGRKLTEEMKLPETLEVSSKDYLMYRLYAQKQRVGSFSNQTKNNAYRKISEEGEAYFREKYGPNYEAFIKAFYNKGATNPSLTINEFLPLHNAVTERLKNEDNFKQIGEKLEQVYDKYISTAPSVAVSIQPPSTNKDFEKLKKNRLDHIKTLIKNMEGKNESPTFKEFVAAIKEAKDLEGIDVTVRVKDDQTKIYSVRLDEDKEMVVQEQDLKELGINYPELLVDKKTQFIQQLLSTSTTTSKTDPNRVETYMARDYVMSNADLPFVSNDLRNSRFSVGINFSTNRDGSVSPTVFIEDLYAPKEFKNYVILKNYLFDEGDLYHVIQTLKGSLSDSELQRIMMQEYNRQAQELTEKNNK